MKQQEDWAIGKPGAEHWMLSLESDTEAWSGRLGKARELSRQAIESARRSDEKEPAALWQANAAIREALFGNADAARQNAAAAVALAPGSRDAEAQAALAYALAGDAAHAQSLADDLAKRFPQDTVVQSVWLPTIRAQIETGRKNAARSIELLQAAAPYELGMLSGSATNSCLYPVYVRAEAYLSAQQGRAAAAEFQKILDHRGLVVELCDQEHSLIFGSREPTRCRATPRKPARRIRISSRCGKMRTPTFPYSLLRKPSTPS